MPDARILVVEDETIVAMDIADSLRRFEYRVTDVVASGEKAIEAVERELPDLVLMDIRLKGKLDGIETARILRERYSIPIVFLTAHSDAPTIERSRSAAPYGYLVKPFEERDLRRTIDIALSRADAERSRQELSDDALWQSEERFHRLVDAVHDYAMILLDERGAIVEWNAGAERIYGYSAAEVVGKRPTFLYADQDDVEATLDRELAQVRATGRMEWEGWRLRKDGARFWANSIRTPTFDRSGRMRGYAAVTRDTSERRALESQLLHAQKLEGLGKLAGGIAHDFNNMLMVIFARCDLLLRLTGTTEPQRRYLLDIKSAATKSRGLVEQLLAAARRQILQPQVVNLNDIVTSTVQLFASSLGEDIEIRTDLQDSLWPTFADPGKLHQVLVNLVINARDAMPKGGVLAIETSNFRADTSVVRQHPQLREAEYVQLTVSDTGTGIPLEIRESVFDPFFSTKPPGSGTGLGLSVARGIVEQTGGHIWFYSEVGEGTTFKMYFPRMRDQAVQEVPPEEEVVVTGGTATILLVEDESLLRTIMREALEENGYRVIEAALPAEALAKSSVPGESIDLLLTDVVMPGMNGVDLAKRIREQYPNVRTIMISGYPDSVIADRGILDPNVRLLQKPVATNVLLRAVQAALE